MSRLPTRPGKKDRADKADWLGFDRELFGKRVMPLLYLGLRLEAA